MSRALKIFLGIELTLGTIWTLLAAMATGSGGLMVFGLFLYIYPVFAVFFLVAAWAYWKHPAERRRAAWVMALPIVFWFLPMTIRGVTGGALSNQQFVALLVLVAIGALATCVFAPQKAVRVLPHSLIRSRLFNALIFTAVLLGWLFIAFTVVWVAAGNAKSGYQGDTGYGLGYAIILASLYMVGLGAGSFFAATWGWLGLRGGVPDAPRKWHIAQIVIALPGIAIGAIVLSWLVGQGQLG